MAQGVEMGSGFDQPNWTFRCSFIRVYSVMAFWVTLGLVTVLLYDEPRPINLRLLPGIIGAIIGGLLLLAPYVAAVVTYFTFKVNPLRIHGCNSWGRYSDLEWDDIATARPIPMGGLGYLRLRSKTSRKVISIPFYLAEFNHFLRLAIEFTEPDNPLHQFASERLKTGRDSSTESVPIRYHYH